MRRSVICHTNDVGNSNMSKPSNLYSIQNILSSETKTMEEKDSGIDEDYDSGRSSDNNRYDTENSMDDVLSSKNKCEFSLRRVVTDILTPSEILKKCQLQDSEFSIQELNILHQKRPNVELTPMVEHLKDFQLMDPKSNEFKRRFESSVLSALRDPQIQYLLTLYSFVDEELLKATLLRFLQGACLDNDTSNAAENYLQREKQQQDCTMSDPNITSSASAQSKTASLFDFITRYKNGQNFSTNNMENDTQRNDFSLPSRERFLSTEEPYQSPPALLSGLNNNKATLITSTRCEYCRKLFSNELSLKRHLRTHEGKRSHKCSLCSRSFYDQASYLRHVRSHNGDKKHKCEQCSMAFNKRSALEVHIRTHTGERPFVCKYCGKGFSISGNLHRHVLIHTGHRPYKCGKCPRAFNNPSHLARHINSFHT